MSACTFFGHRDCPSSIKPKLREVLINLIENHAVDMFYVGQRGAFDGIVRSVLKELVSLYPHIRYAVVLERLPPKDTRNYSDTILPESIPASLSLGVITGCSSNPTMSLHISPTLGAERLSSQRKPNAKRRLY